MRTGAVWKGSRIAALAPDQPLRDRAVPAVTRRRTLTFAIAQVAVVALLGGLVELALLYSGVADPPSWVTGLFAVQAWIYVAVGSVAWLRRPSSLMGVLMTAGGFLWLGAGLANTPVPALEAAGYVVTTLPLAVVVHLLLGFPSGRLRTRGVRAIALGGYVVCGVLQAPLYLFAADGPLTIADRPDLVTAADWVQRIAGAAVVVATCAILARRLRAAPPAQRRVLAPLSVYGIAAVLAIPVGPALADLLFGGGGLTLVVVQLALLAGVPVAFAVAASRGGFARTGEIEELGAWLGAGEGGRPALADALAAALGDPTLELLFRVPGEDGWVAGDGVAALLPANGSERGVVQVELAGRAIGAIVYDSMLLDRRDDVHEAGRIVALALDHERLTVELRASRARIVEAGDAERRRIARDLHDGLQSRLVLLAVKAGVMGDGATELRTGIETAIDELRALVHGVVPAELTERGLAAAVEGLADRMPISVELRVEGLADRLPPAVESTGYFVVSEALVNAVKHARAGELAVTLLRADGDRLRIEVRDDGVGGAGAGNGTRSMADRVEALGGWLRIDSTAGRGTRVEVEIPCGS